MNRGIAFLIAIVIGCCGGRSSASDINIQLPGDKVVTKAEAKASGTDPIEGTIEAGAVRFKNVSPNTVYDLTLTLKDGTILQGVNLGWYSLEPAKPQAADLSDDDKQQITDILKQVLSFYNKNDILRLNGNHDRATALVQLVRDKAFHSDTGDEVIWHIELWYFKNQHGGWEKVQQANKVLRRERFSDHKSYQDVIDHLKWLPELGGLKVAKDAGDLKVILEMPKPESPNQ